MISTLMIGMMLTVATAMAIDSTFTLYISLDQQDD